MTTDPFAVLEATWPSVSVKAVDGWLVRDGGGGGKRVSAATWDSAGVPPALPHDLVMVREGQDKLDSVLAETGFETVDPTLIFEGSVASNPIPPVTAFSVWPPLRILLDIWEVGGIGPARVGVMERVEGPKTAILGRINDRAAGALFAAIHKNCVMLHAIEVLAAHRRQGLARYMMQAAHNWAAEHGATQVSLAVTSANEPATRLYKSMGMGVVGRYHYRQRP
ncbi:GNAT family N-acetyltransferase [Litoreibacter roseus]|uniref:N-acetyltransferase n=1 Tax=Litoreibacter roseus TaxID=2601869 RepID=A0A6N6JDT8_9RHOB|nr:GNAT family N-acetyltransferase [Litoreibacter roseus]GFE64493.1 N-acetyltransferase [Litoreibacter roseus]